MYKEDDRDGETDLDWGLRRIVYTHERFVAEKVNHTNVSYYFCVSLCLPEILLSLCRSCHCVAVIIIITYLL